MNKQRIIIFDFMKVIAVFLIIVTYISEMFCQKYPNISLGDFLTADFLNVIGKVAIPILFMISGALLLEQKTDWTKYRKKIFRLFLVTAIFTIIYFLWNTFYLNIEYNLWNTLINVFFNPIKTHLWILYVLLGINIILPFIKKMIENLSHKEENLLIILWLTFSGGVYFIISLLGWLVNLNIEVNYPIPVIQIPFYLGYFIAGYILSKRIKSLKKEQRADWSMWSIILAIFSIVVAFSLVFIQSNLANVYNESLINYSSILVMISSLSIFTICLINRTKVEQKLNKRVVLMFSEQALLIYLIFPIYLDIFKKYLDITIPIAIFSIITFSIILALVSLLTTYLLNKIWLLFKKRN